MSPWVNRVVGISMVLGAIGFWIIGEFYGPIMPSGPLPFYGFAAFCAIVAAACLVPASRSVTLRIIGAVIFAACVFNCVVSFGTPRFIRACGGLILFGLPFGYMAIRGCYPDWGHGSAAAHPSSKDDDADAITRPAQQLDTTEYWG